MAVVLLVLPWALAWLLARGHHLDLATAVAVAAGAAATSAGLPVVWLTWALYRDSKKSAVLPTELSMAQIADQLAVAVGAQWQAEAAVRRLNDPYPLPVSWAPADPSLTDSWESLVRLASSGAGWPAPPPTEKWAASQDGLGGAGGELLDVIARVPTSRLVVLGEPGSGKTMLMVRLVLDLLVRRRAGGPVPILVPLASWDPAELDLRSWLATQLLIDHPALAAAPPADREESTRASALLASGLILPVLDGLDEVPEQVRGSAISRVNETLRPGEPLVVTCRTEQYREVIGPTRGAEITLRGAAAVQLRPLDPNAVRGYLVDDAGGPFARARWDQVLKLLGSEAPVGQALKLPLMVGLARVIYNPRPGELTGALRDPAELCGTALADQTAVEMLLFDAFIPAAYRNNLVRHWKVSDVEKWLVFLAGHLEYDIRSPSLAWWELPRHENLRISPSRGIRIGVRDFITGYLTMSSGAIILGLLSGITAGIHGGFREGFIKGLQAGFGVLVAGGLIQSFMIAAKGAPSNLETATSPRVLLARDRRTTSLVWLGCTTVVGLAGGIVDYIHPSLESPSGSLLLSVLVWSAFGFAVGSFIAFRQTAWPLFGLTKIWLAVRHRLPWRFMAFLADAHQRGVLRQVGGVYQFRHIELQHRLATRPSEPPEITEEALDA
jgi:NACHT domain